MSRSGDLPGDPTPASNAVRLTYDDFVLFPDDGQRHELIDGEHYVTPSPDLKHQAVLGNLHLAIGNWLAQHPLGRVFFAPFDVVFTRFDVVEPDLLYMSKSDPEGKRVRRRIRTSSPQHILVVTSQRERFEL